MNERITAASHSQLATVSPALVAMSRSLFESCYREGSVVLSRREQKTKRLFV